MYNNQYHGHASMRTILRNSGGYLSSGGGDKLRQCQSFLSSDPEYLYTKITAIVR
jgi:hypothetical protein